MSIVGPPTKAQDSPGGILAIGDSVMAWNGRQGIPEAVSARLGRPVTDRARSGAHLTHPNALARATGFDISRRFNGGSWDWVILTGGGNDIRRDCATRSEPAARDRLISADLRGDIPTLIARIRATGARVGFVGYYDGPTFRSTGFSRCQGAFDVINSRMAQLAGTDPGVLFFDAGTVFDASDPASFARDLIHPSALGSRAIGTALADAMRAAEG